MERAALCKFFGENKPLKKSFYKREQQRATQQN
jgi:hypothetical protein